MKQERLRILGALVLTAMVSSFGTQPAAAQAKLVPGKLAGVVRDSAGNTLAIEVGRYFETQAYVEEWIFSGIPAEERAGIEPFRIPVFHHPLSAWVEFLSRAGLVIEQLGEPRASAEVAEAVPRVADTRVAPLFLHVRARKTSTPR